MQNATASPATTAARRPNPGCSRYLTSKPGEGQEDRVEEALRRDRARVDHRRHGHRDRSPEQRRPLAHDPPREQVGGDGRERHHDRVRDLRGRVGVDEVVEQAVGGRDQRRVQEAVTADRQLADRVAAGIGEAARELAVDRLVDEHERRHHVPDEPDPQGRRRGRRSRTAMPRRGRPRAGSPTEVDLGEPARDLRGLGRPRRDADVGRCGAHLPQDTVRDGGASCDLFERGRLALGSRSRPWSPARPSERAAPIAARAWGCSASNRNAAARSSTSRVPTRDLQGDFVRQFGEPAGVGHDERLPERQRADRRPARLAHRRRAKADVDVAGGHERPQPPLVDEPLADHPVSLQAEPLEPAVEVETGRGGADHQEPGARVLRPHAGERLEQLRDTLRVVDVPEGADERRTGNVRRCDVGHGPGGMRDAGDHTGEPRLQYGPFSGTPIDSHPRPEAKRCEIISL